MRIDATHGELSVLTFKEGFLSPVAHDLELSVQRFTIDVDQDEVDVRVDASSLDVRGVLRDGRLDPAALSEADRRTIAGTIRSEVLKAAQYPEIRYVGRVSDSGATDQLDLAGSLTLVGVTRALTVQSRRASDRYQGEVVLHQPDFGIRPYAALLGALKIRADVIVRFRVPLGTAGAL
jgi:polyisoprenoid-binding protein YceI